LIERQIRERRLGALEEELGQAGDADAGAAEDIEDLLPGGIEDLEPLPLLSVDKDLDAAIPGRGVDLEDDLGLAQLFGPQLLDRAQRSAVASTATIKVCRKLFIIASPVEWSRRNADS
jgi:hypothetical protein